MVGIFALIAILIAIMGGYGLITFNSKYRVKEIAIRKVQGSSNEEIMLMLNIGMLILLITLVTVSRQSHRKATANPIDELKNE